MNHQSVKVRSSSYSEHTPVYNFKGGKGTKGVERKQRMETSSFMKQLLSKDNLNAAYLQVLRNKGAVGVDAHDSRRTWRIPLGKRRKHQGTVADKEV